MPLTSDADVELISAYLDNYITPTERATLENRLAHEPALQQLLDDMRGTVGMLRALEPVRPPRSFALDPATVPAMRGWAIPALWLRFGSALAVLLFAITLTLDLAGSNSSSLSTSAAAGAGAFAPAVAESAATTAPASEAAGAPAAESRAAIAAEATAAAASNARVAAPETTAAAGAEKQAADTMQADASAPAPQADALSANAGISDPQSSSPSTGSFEAQTTAPVSAPPPVHPLLLVEIGFGALAFLLLLASFFVARRRS